MSKTQTKFRPVPGVPGIWASADGKIRLDEYLSAKGVRKERITNGTLVPTGPPLVRYRGTRYSVARLVLAAWGVPMPNVPFPAVAFRDGDPTNCAISNLQWDPARSKMTFEKLRELRNLYKKGQQKTQIAKRLGVHRASVLYQVKRLNKS